MIFATHPVDKDEAKNTTATMSTTAKSSDIRAIVASAPQDIHTGINLASETLALQISNHSDYSYDKLLVTVSYFDYTDSYLDYSDHDIPKLSANKQVEHQLQLALPRHTDHLVVDVSGEKQTFIQRHWRAISTVGILLWGVIVLTRRFS